MSIRPSSVIVASAVAINSSVVPVGASIFIVVTAKIPLYDGLIVRSATKVSKKIIDSATNLKIIGRAGAGVDNIDLISAKEKKVIYRPRGYPVDAN